VSSASVDKVPRQTKRRMTMDKAEPVKPDCMSKCVSFFNIIALLPRWMQVSDIEREDKSVYNEEKARIQQFEYTRKINKIVEDRGMSSEEAELVYLQEEGEFEMASVAYKYTLGILCWKLIGK
jgi:hypothetical protein